ncbi:class I SAM-dependent methyltransferase [Nannocystis pusilla]|uniref:Methyltransferase domain-containing protein n=1 Tax=Nannocystis pusilla TaxID=889268 RepID=A0ABS7TU19_9BACT|nr:methyltransferase domain-containing protein [Nannocystis pusilla]MBZ5711729.1 methyltransferase domain-containing protein [Nannocystis pusilla]
MSGANQQQIEHWNGPGGASWRRHQERLDDMFAAFSEAALRAAAVRPGERVLDVGCGAGATTLALAGMVGPGGAVVGVDVSAPLLGRARERADAAGLAVELRLADAADAPLGGPYDLLFSRFGVMFFADPVAAFTHLRAAAKPDGRLAFMCWRAAADNDWGALPHRALRDLLPPLPPTDPSAPGPFAFADRGRVLAILEAAGFRDVALAPFDAPLRFGRGDSREAALDDALAQAAEVGPLTRLLAGHDDDLRRRALAAVRAAFAERAGPDGVFLRAAAWIVTARA